MILSSSFSYKQAQYMSFQNARIIGGVKQTIVILQQQQINGTKEHVCLQNWASMFSVTNTKKRQSLRAQEFEYPLEKNNNLKRIRPVRALSFSLHISIACLCLLVVTCQKMNKKYFFNHIFLFPRTDYTATQEPAHYQCTFTNESFPNSMLKIRSYV